MPRLLPGRSFLLTVCLFLSRATVVATAEPPAAKLTAPELRAELLRNQERIRSIYVVYTSDDYDESQLPRGTFLRRTVAAKAPDSLLHMTAHGHDTLPWPDDPYQQRARIRNGHVYNEYPLNRSYYEANVDLKKDGLPGTLVTEFLFNATGVWPLSGVKPPRLDGEPYVLREVAVSDKYNHVRPKLESVEGRWCHVFERPERDRLWIDVDRGCAMLARETHASTTGRLGQRIELGGHREVHPGIWFPMWLTNIQYDHNATDERKQRRIWKNARHNVLEIHINDVDDSVFQWEPPRGAVRILDDGAPVQTRPGGEDHLDEIASWVRRHHRFSTQDSWRIPPAVVVALLILLATASCDLGYRFWIAGRKRHHDETTKQ